jgi:hypothetical protein
MKINQRASITAHHEAAHAVVAFWLRVRIAPKGVTIVPDGDARGSIYISHKIGGDPTVGEVTDKMVANAERRVMILLAGLEGQRRYRASSVRNWHAHTDYTHAVNLLSHFAADEREIELWIRLLLFRTRKIVECRWEFIEGLAQVLLDKRSLKGDEILVTIRSIMDERCTVGGRSLR